MKRLAVVAAITALLSSLTIGVAIGAPPEKGPKGAACPTNSPQPDNTPPNCGNDKTPGGGGGSNTCPHDDRTPPNCGNGGGGGGNACPHDDRTPPNCGKPCKNHGGDTDGDGVCNDVDQCDNQPGPASNNGCPLPCADKGGDTDGDGVCNDDDLCDNKAGPAANKGCPYKGPCHRQEGILGPDGLDVANQEAQQNPVGEQAYHAALGTLPVFHHPGADETATPNDNSSLGDLADLYEADLPLQLGPEGACLLGSLGPPED